MKKCLLCCLAALLFCELFLFGCAPKSKVTPLSLPTLDYKGNIQALDKSKVEYCDTTFMIFKRMMPESDFWLTIEEDEDALPQTIIEEEAPQTREFTLGGFAYTLKYANTLVYSDGEKTRRYGLRRKDLRSDMMALVPKGRREHLKSENIEDFVCTAFVDVNSDRVYAATDFPSGYYATGQESESFLKEKAIALLSENSDLPYETYYCTITSYYRDSQGSPQKETGVYNLKEGETLNSYKFEFSMGHEGRLTNRIAYVSFFGYGSSYIWYGQTPDFTAQDMEKIETVDLEYLYGQVVATYAKELPADWKLTDYSVQSQNFSKKDGVLRLYMNVTFKVQTDNRQLIKEGGKDTYEFPLTLYAEII